MFVQTWRRVVRSIFPERTAFFAAAPTETLSEQEIQNAPYPIFRDKEKCQVVNTNQLSELSERSSFRKPNSFDKITVFAGSSITFFVILFLITVWAFFGLAFGPTDIWQIVFQNASSIQVYVIDILLIRQQQNASRSLMTILAEFHSRRSTVERLLDQIPGCDKVSLQKERPRELYINDKPFSDECDVDTFVPHEEMSKISYAWSQSCLIMAHGIGSIWSFLLYWIGIAFWAAMGPSIQFSDRWQLYINTATALALTFTSVFLQNIQQREEDNLTRCLQHTISIDAEIERQLRLLTGDQKPNTIYTLPDSKRTPFERFNDVSADIMGSGLGVVISLTFVAIWIAIGPQMQFNDNWWLIIGSFTGLVGFVDGFVLRSLYYREEIADKEQFQKLAMAEQLLLNRLNIPNSVPPEIQNSLTSRITLYISDACGNQYAPSIAIGIVVGLLAVATALNWSMTGQLLCNTPTMIIEGFLLILLIHAHNHSRNQRYTDFTGLLKRKLLLQGFVKTII